MIYWERLLGFLQVGCFAFGGVYGAIPLIRDVVLGYGWLDDEEVYAYAETYYMTSEEEFERRAAEKAETEKKEREAVAKKRKEQEEKRKKVAKDKKKKLAAEEKAVTEKSAAMHSPVTMAHIQASKGKGLPFSEEMRTAIQMNPIRVNCSASCVAEGTEAFCIP